MHDIASCRDKTFTLKAALCAAAFSSVVASNAWASFSCSSQPSLGAPSQPVTYSGYVVTDVSLGGHFYHNAEVTFTFKGDAKDIHTFTLADPLGSSDSGVSSYSGGGQCIDAGTVTVSIVTAKNAISATVGNVFVSFDMLNSGIGFSSYSGPHGFEPAYPLAFVSGIIGPSYGTVFSNGGPLNATFNATGYAWSCIGYPPLSDLNPSHTCADPTQYPLPTNHGSLVIYQPYNNIDPSNGSLCCNFGGTLNRGTFSSAAGY